MLGRTPRSRRGPQSSNSTGWSILKNSVQPATRDDVRTHARPWRNTPADATGLSPICRPAPSQARPTPKQHEMIFSMAGSSPQPTAKGSSQTSGDYRCIKTRTERWIDQRTPPRNGDRGRYRNHKCFAHAGQFLHQPEHESAPTCVHPRSLSPIAVRTSTKKTVLEALRPIWRIGLKGRAPISEIT